MSCHCHCHRSALEREFDFIGDMIFWAMCIVTLWYLLKAVFWVLSKGVPWLLVGLWSFLTWVFCADGNTVRSRRPDLGRDSRNRRPNLDLRGGGRCLQGGCREEVAAVAGGYTPSADGIRDGRWLYAKASERGVLSATDGPRPTGPSQTSPVGVTALPEPPDG